MEPRREQVQMVGMLRRAGYRDPVHEAKRLEREGVSPAELDWRLRTGQRLEKTTKNPLASAPAQQIELVKSKRKHAIGMEVPRGGSSCASCRFLVDAYGRRTGAGRYCSLAAWVTAPKRDGGGGGDPTIPRAVDRWCCDGYEIRGTRENPLDRSVFGNLTPLETVLVIGGGTAALVGLAWLALKIISPSSTASAAPVIPPTSLPPTPGTLDVTGPPGQTATNLLPPPGTPVTPPVYVPGGSPLPVAPT